MSVEWFSKVPRGSYTTVSDLKLTFTDKPKGIRCNVALTNALSGTTRVKIGLDDNLFIIRPTDEDEGFKLVTNKSSAQICAAQIGDWATEKGLIKKRITGIWNEQVGQYEFDLDQVEEEEQEQVSEQVSEQEAMG